jgi:hypothetical protein
MISMKLRLVALAVSVLVMLVAWAAVIWVALQVSSTVLNTLDMIVELAAMN